jgi:opacity protein-like surface antigen
MHARHGRRTVTLILAFVTVLAVALWVPRAAAAESERATKWQFSVPITFTSGASYDSQEGTSVKMDDDLGFGVGFGYHFDKRFFLGVDFTWLNANYDVHLATDNNGDQIPDTTVDVAGTLDATNLQFVGQYNILRGRFTPFLRASLGWTWVDSNIPSGPATGTCWWDPWWGYVCNTWQPTFQDTSFAYGAAAGVRAELTDRFFIEGSYNVLWVDFSKAGTQNLDGIRVSAGWVF